MKYTNVEEIRQGFIKQGWNENISFKELSYEEATKKGLLFAMINIQKGRKYFIMDTSNNIYDDNGKIALFDIPVRKGE